jgi:flagellar motor component MotA
VLTVIGTIINNTIGGENPLIGNEFIVTVGGGISAFLMGSHRKTQTPAGKNSE